MFNKRKNQNIRGSEQFLSHVSSETPLNTVNGCIRATLKSLSYPIGQAARQLGISKHTFLKRALDMGVEFEWDGRGRRIRRDDLLRIKEGKAGKPKSNFFDGVPFKKGKEARKRSVRHSEASEPEKKAREEKLSNLLSFLPIWWIGIKITLHNQKCFVTAEDFISVRRSLKRFLEEMEPEELELINSFELYEIFKAHLQKLCPKRREEDENLNAQKETQVIEDILEGIEEIREEIAGLHKEQSELSLWLFLCVLGLIYLLAPLARQQSPELAQQPPA